MLNWTSWKKRTVVLMIGSLLLTVPLTANAALASKAAYQGDAVKAISLKLGDSSINANALVTSVEFIGLLNKSAALAGSNSLFKMKSSSTITREEAALLLDDTLKLTDAPESFKDIPDNTTLSFAVGSVMKALLMNGVDSTRFAPKGALTYGQAYAIAYRVYDFLKPFDVVETTIADIQHAIEQGKLTSKELVQLYLDRIEKYDDQGIKLNAILTVNPKALQIAEQLDDERIQKGSRGPLHGIPIIVKDNYDTNDMPTTAGCLCLKDSIPLEDADQIAKLKAAGAIILAKSNLHEFAFGITTQSSLGGQTLNPYGLTHNPGGSSGGTGASIAANFALAGLGTDTGGSIRIPSSYNSLVGIRPTIGLSSRDGIIPLALTQDVGGPMARTVTDAAILLDATAGYDPDDISTAYNVGKIPTSYTDFLDINGLKGARIGVATELFGTTAEEKPVTDLIKKAVTDLKTLGAETIEIKIPKLADIMKYPSLSSFEFKFQLNEYLADLGPNAPYKSLTEIITSGLYDKSQESSLKSRDALTTLETEQYKDIVLLRTKVTRESLLKVMADNNLDAIVYPSTSQTASLVGESGKAGSNNRLSPYSGFPAITVPAGFTAEGMPAGIEFLGRSFEEATLIKLSYAYEQGTHNRKSPVLTP
ncbi:amidase family protein [Bacillus sp. FJAT-28004]|uniref:amidase family protein n=1 Tax=Bacillus sp. FJAT-28004 TaxID=1679165 RepID=UPI0006B4A342|nr:amidase family protein [Bacillus sp. FJAT-28004]